jgi:hypothetical protein
MSQSTADTISPSEGIGSVQRAPSIRPLLHPTEPSRLGLALVASVLALGLPIYLIVRVGGITPVAELGLALSLFIASIYLSIQLSRARLLGRSVRVDAFTFPQLQEVIDEVRATLRYERPFEVYVTRSAARDISMTSLLGTRLILIEGDLLADLSKPDKRSQLVFLIGSYVGALRAQHARVDLLVLIMQWAEVLKYVNLLILPYYRATTYSGDQIGAMCCGDIGASLQAGRRLLVGAEMAEGLTAGAVLPQAMLVKQRALPRLVQLTAAEPHITNRYANLLCFCRFHDPELWERLRASMDTRELDFAEQVWRRSPFSRHALR